VKYLDAAAVTALGHRAAVQSVVDALRGGLDPADDIARAPVGLRSGQFLLMPSQTSDAAGIKVVTVAPDNPRRGLPRIQGVYLLFDQDTLTLQAIMDGTALTALRTPAVSVACVLDRLPESPLDVVVVGAGPQAVGHVTTLHAVRALGSVTYLVREPARAPVEALPIDSDQARDKLGTAHVVVCATSARTPLFDSRLLRDDCVVIAVGSHEPDARELDAALLRRATVVVEDVATAVREAGDVVMAITEKALAPSDLICMRDVVTNAVAVPDDRPMVFKTVGMSWQDLVVATAVLRQHHDGR
jgi:ornithine cyclodeaminase